MIPSYGWGLESCVSSSGLLAGSYDESRTLWRSESTNQSKKIPSRLIPNEECRAEFHCQPVFNERAGVLECGGRDARAKIRIVDTAFERRLAFVTSPRHRKAGSRFASHPQSKTLWRIREAAACHALKSSTDSPAPRSSGSPSRCASPSSARAVRPLRRGSCPRRAACASSGVLRGCKQDPRNS